MLYAPRSSKTTSEITSKSGSHLHDDMDWTFSAWKTSFSSLVVHWSPHGGSVPSLTTRRMQRFLYGPKPPMGVGQLSIGARSIQVWRVRTVTRTQFVRFAPSPLRSLILHAPH